jgi:hypothetical protein
VFYRPGEGIEHERVTSSGLIAGLPDVVLDLCACFGCCLVFLRIKVTFWAKTLHFAFFWISVGKIAKVAKFAKDCGRLFQYQREQGPDFLPDAVRPLSKNVFDAFADYLLSLDLSLASACRGGLCCSWHLSCLIRIRVCFRRCLGENTFPVRLYQLEFQLLLSRSRQVRWPERFLTKIDLIHGTSSMAANHPMGILCLWQALLIASVLVSQVLGEKAFAAHGKYFVSMHFTDNAPPPKKKALSFVFNLPPTDKMEDLTRLVSLIPFYIDLVGRLRLTAQVSSTILQIGSARMSVESAQVFRCLDGH